MVTIIKTILNTNGSFHYQKCVKKEKVDGLWKKTYEDRVCTPLPKIDLTKEEVREVMESVVENYEGSSYDPLTEYESVDYLEINKTEEEVLAFLEKKLGSWEDLADMESMEEVYSYLEDLMNDHALSLFKIESHGSSTLPQDNQAHYNPCEGCGGEDCCCCDYGKGY